MSAIVQTIMLKLNICKHIHACVSILHAEQKFGENHDIVGQSVDDLNLTSIEDTLQVTEIIQKARKEITQQSRLKRGGF